MSKSSLKKELVTFTNEQLVEVILNAYSSSKEAKAYFEFFLNPDVDALFEKKIDIIAKELNRTKWGYCKARISIIRGCIRDFESFGVGAEAVAKLMYSTLRMLVGQYRYLNYGEPLMKGVGKLTADYIAYAHTNGFASTALANINALASEEGLGTPQMRAAVKKRALDTVEELTSGAGR